MRREEQHNTDEQVAKYVRKALDLLDELAVADDLRPHVFTLACNLYSAKQIIVEQVAPGLLELPGVDRRL